MKSWTAFCPVSQKDLEIKETALCLIFPSFTEEVFWITVKVRAECCWMCESCVMCETPHVHWLCVFVALLWGWTAAAAEKRTIWRMRSVTASLCKKHVESMRSAVERLEGDVQQERTRNGLLQQHLDTLRSALTHSFSAVPPRWDTHTHTHTHTHTPRVHCENLSQLGSFESIYIYIYIYIYSICIY